MFEKWPWKIYAVLLMSLMTREIQDILTKDSPFCSYYTILIAFNKFYWIPLALNIASLLINLLIPLVVLCYAFKIKNTLKFWKTLFFMRIFLDLAGHHYNLQFIKAAFFQNLTYGLICLAVFILPILPSYVAHYLYAFRNQRNKS